MPINVTVHPGPMGMRRGRYGYGYGGPPPGWYPGVGAGYYDPLLYPRPMPHMGANVYAGVPFNTYTVNFPLSKYTMEVVEARNLTAADRGGTSDPYVMIRISGSFPNYSSPNRFKTQTIQKTVNPKWSANFPFSISGDPALTNVNIRVFDADRFRDDSLGMASVSLSQLIGEGGWVPLSGKDAGKGQVFIRVTLISKPTTQPTPGVAEAPGATPPPYAGPGAPPAAAPQHDVTALPPPWAQAYDTTGRLYFVNTTDKTSTYRDPRTGHRSPKPVHQEHAAKRSAAAAGNALAPGDPANPILTKEVPPEFQSLVVPPPKDDGESDDDLRSEDSEEEEEPNKH